MTISRSRSAITVTSSLGRIGFHGEVFGDVADPDRDNNADSVEIKVVAGRR